MDIEIMRYVLDTNVALYLLGGRLANPLPVGEVYLSVISEIEMLSYPTIPEAETLAIHQFLSQVTVIGIDEAVKQMTIALRKKYRLKLPDAIVCASVLSVNAILLSNDVQLNRITEISVNAVQIQ
ncbi:type II toxin-antitoxin system VapC family toxin [Leptolyngbya sp. 7M]|uniref:type II toxin-antitoxin system VapC family toxin n=1 Tax=Leptolyngbya sp. 7M TaxID=2812896 RepID=UPI001B8C86B1|nr:type II toxin-antitoxin system VapC family toxin [Leptolyngbya sp. 7M]QYO67614.1 type II toxin-antitoxin system VapC family toxin [Leptolyngbya sp. 7M]